MRARVFLLTFAAVLVAGQLAVGMRASRTASVTGDEPFYLLTTQSLLSDGDLDLRDEYARGEDRRFWDGTVPLWKQMEPTDDGRLLSPHDPGLSVLTLTAYAVGGLRGVQRFLAALWALAMAVAALVAVRLRAPPWAAGVAAVAVGAGTPGVVYASQVYPEGTAALAVALALLLVTGERARPVLFAATLTGLVWLGVKYTPLAVVLAAAWAWKQRARGERGAVAVAGVLLAVAAAHFAWWHLHTFGGLTPYSTNVVYAGNPTAEIVAQHVNQGGRSYRLVGLFLDARFGLFRWLPATVLALWGVGRRRPPTLLPAAVLGLCVLMGTYVSITMMGWWFPGRMLVAGFAGLVVLAAHGAARLPRLSLAVAAWGLAIAAATAWSAHHGGIRLAVDPFTLGFPLAPRSLFPDFRSLGAGTVAGAAAWVLVLAAARSIAPNGEAHAPRRQLPRLPGLLRPPHGHGNGFGAGHERGVRVHVDAGEPAQGPPA